MTTNNSDLPVTIDYTSRDYYSLRDALIARVKNNINVPGSGVSWTGENTSDFAVALIEAFAYMGDNISYYIDRIANENFIGTATQRQSIIDLAKMYGYTPSGYRAASCSVVFYNSGSSDVTIPAGTQVSGEVIFNDVAEEVIFTTTSDVLVPAAGGNGPGVSETVTAIHGELVSTRAGNDPVYGELVGVSDGLPGQSFILSENQVVENSIQVYVEVGNGTDYTLWSPVVHLADSGPSDAVFTVETDADNYVTITFGDGVSGNIPTLGSAIRVNYSVGGGQLGNITSGVLNNIRYVPNNVSVSSITVTNSTSATNGADPESEGSIRTNAPIALRALNRAVTLQDYSSLALLVSAVGKANATADTKNSVTLYIAPQQNTDSTDLYPGYTGDPSNGGVLTQDWPSLVSSVQQYLANKTQIGVSVTVAQPTYVPVNLLLRFTKHPQYTDDQVKTNILLALVNVFSYNSMQFQDIVSPEEIEYEMRQVDGVYSVNVASFYRAGYPGRNTLLGGPGEIFVFDEANLDVVANSSDSTLASLTPSVGTLSPTFSSSQLNYNLSAPNGTTSMTFTPVNTTGKITVNGVATSSGSATSVTVTVGITTVQVAVTAQDGITTKTYQVNVTRAS
jgi:Cadherin-like beta sandwich domain/Baseplate J-like protein